MAKKSSPPSTLRGLRDRMAKQYGDRVVRRDTVQSYEVIPTGSLTLDLATRVGGWVRGRTHEIVGQEGVGKTTVCISSMVQAQAKYPDLAVGYIDMEQTFDYAWAEGLGLNTDDDQWFHIYPDDSEDVSDQIRQMADTGLFSLLVVDSIGGMESKEAFDKDAGEKVMGRNAQIITRMAKHISVLCRRNKVAVIFVNQYRANIPNPQGPDISAGPKALRYATTMKVEMSRTGESPLKVGAGDDIETVGYQMRARVSRNKVAAQGKRAEFWIMNQPSKQFGPIGINRSDEAVTIGIYTEVIEQGGGGYYTLPGGTRIKGRDSLLEYLRTHPEDMESVREQAVARLSHDVHEENVVDFEQEAAG